MLLQFEQGELAVWLLSGIKISVLWDEITHDDKPVWFDIEPEELQWEEDLVWKEYLDLEDSLVKPVEIIDTDDAVVGLVITTDKKEIGIVDNGDNTIALEDDALWQYLDEERAYGFMLSNVLEK